MMPGCSCLMMADNGLCTASELACLLLKDLARQSHQSNSLAERHPAKNSCYL